MRSRQTVILRMQKCGATPTLYRCFEEVGGGAPPFTSCSGCARYQYAVRRLPINHLPRRPKAPSPTWRSFQRNHVTDIAAVDMFVVATATFKLLNAMIVLDHHRRRTIHFDVTRNPTQI
jgi:hypothetical protein